MAAEATPGPPREHVSDPLSVLHSTCAQRGWPLEVESIGLGRGGNAHAHDFYSRTYLSRTLPPPPPPPLPPPLPSGDRRPRLPLLLPLTSPKGRPGQP